MPNERPFSNKETITISIRLPKHTYELVYEDAKKHNHSMNQELITLVQEALAQRGIELKG